MTTSAGRGQAQRALARIATVGMVVGLVATTSAGASPSAGGQSGPTKINVVIIAVDATGQVMYAKDRGFFRKHGIDAEITFVADGTLTPPAVISGQAQFAGVPTGALATLKVRGFPLKAVAGGALYEPGTSTSGLVSAPGRQFRRARDLVGKQIGLDFRGSVAELGLKRWLKRGGVSPDDVELVFDSFPRLIGPLIRGQIDAAWLPEPQATLAVRRGAKLFAKPFDATCSELCLVTVYMARTNVDPNLAARFRLAMQDAAVWANQPRNRTARARILEKYLKIDLGLVQRMAWFSYAPRLRVGLAQPFLDLYVEYGLIPDTFKATDLVR
jgi:NitT/TauT family transport system substrate-binding protein